MNTASAEGRFVLNRRFDTTFIMGGAALTLLLPIFVTAVPAALPIVFWSWLIFFEGSHFWATLSRTYFDRKFSGEYRGVLFGSLVFFLLPALAIAHWKATGSKLAIDLYGFGIFVWSLYHNARQHYGFMSIYSKRGVESGETKSSRTRLLYLAICLPQFYFLMFNKGPLALSFFPKPEELGMIGMLIKALCWSVSGGVGLVLLSKLVRSSPGSRPMTLIYTAVCWVFYCAMFYGVAPREPFFTGAQNGAQLLMLLAVMNSLFHNIQYHAIVWIYARRRYVEAAEKSKDTSVFGWAAKINGSFLSYGAAAIAMGGVFAWIVSGLGDWPAWNGAYTTTEMSSWSYVLFFGIVGHHFFLDQHIWRPSRQPELSAYLKLDANPAPSGLGAAPA